MDGIAWASSAMVAARTRLEIATDNLANVSSDGFRKTLARGRIGARGVEIERTASPARGSLRPTGRDTDLAIVGAGAFRLRGADGAIVRSRDGAFARDRDGTLHDAQGRTLLGRRGALRVPAGAVVEADGRVVGADGRAIDRLPLAPGSSVRRGFLESANVNAIGEMVDVLSATRSFESAQKVVAAIDGVRRKASGDVARVQGAS